MLLLLNIADFFNHLFHHPSKFFEPEELVRYGGLAVLFLIVYAQTGLFFCFFFPGDALIFSSGVLFASGTFHHQLYVILFFLISAAVLGNITGYWFGRKTGPLLLRRKDSFFFKHEYLETAKEFYDRYDGWAITAGMFLPIIRTFAPIIAGVLQLRFAKFFLYVLLGSSAWIGSLVSLGYFLGNFTWVRKNLHFIVIAMVVVITVPVLYRLIKTVRSARKLRLSRK
ncbi:MAG TPA: VTT domain-containing protein [Chitinophagales bacterium]|nr:VTT domain-containing protein [Chitinophagales bacterium]